MNSRQKDYHYYFKGQYDQTSKLIDSSANRGLGYRRIPIPWWPGLIDLLYMEVEAKIPAWPIPSTTSFCQYSLQRKMGFDPLCTADRLLCQWWFRDMTMADEEIRTSFQNYLDQLRQQYLGKHSDHFPRIRLPRQLRRSQEGDRCHLPSRLRSSLWKNLSEN